MRAALESQASLPAEPPRLPGEFRDERPVPRPSDGASARAAQKAVESHGRASFEKVKEEAKVHAQGNSANAGNSAVGAARSNAAKEKAKKDHPHKQPKP
jgi:hypothetical protein